MAIAIGSHETKLRDHPYVRIVEITTRRTQRHNPTHWPDTMFHASTQEMPTFLADRGMGILGMVSLPPLG